MLITRDNNPTWKQLAQSSDSFARIFRGRVSRRSEGERSYVAKPRKGHVFRTRVFSSRLSIGLSSGIVSWTDCKYRTISWVSFATTAHKFKRRLIKFTAVFVSLRPLALYMFSFFLSLPDKVCAFQADARTVLIISIKAAELFMNLLVSLLLVCNVDCCL